MGDTSLNSSATSGIGLRDSLFNRSVCAGAGNQNAKVAKNLDSIADSAREYLAEKRSKEGAQLIKEHLNAALVEENLNFLKNAVIIFEAYGKERRGANETEQCFVDLLTCYDRLVSKYTRDREFLMAEDYLKSYDSALRTAEGLRENDRRSWQQQFILRAGLLLFAKCQHKSFPDVRSHRVFAAACFGYVLASYCTNTGSKSPCDDFTVLQAWSALKNFEDTVSDGSFWKAVEQCASSQASKEQLFRAVFPRNNDPNLMNMSNLSQCRFGEFEKLFLSDIASRLRDLLQPACCHQITSLDNLVWIFLRFSNRATNDIVIESGPLLKMFGTLQFYCEDISRDRVDSLSVLDLMVFLHLTIAVTCTRPVEHVLPPDLCYALCSDHQRKWWTAAYCLTHNLGKSDQRLYVDRGLQTVRLMHRGCLELRLMVSVARMLEKQGRRFSASQPLGDAKESACYHYAARYWKEILVQIDDGFRSPRNASSIFSTGLQPLNVQEIEAIRKEAEAMLTKQIPVLALSDSEITNGHSNDESYAESLYEMPQESPSRANVPNPRTGKELHISKVLHNQRAVPLSTGVAAAGRSVNFMTENSAQESLLLEQNKSLLEQNRHLSEHVKELQATNRELQLDRNEIRAVERSVQNLETMMKDLGIEFRDLKRHIVEDRQRQSQPSASREHEHADQATLQMSQQLATAYLTQLTMLQQQQQQQQHQAQAPAFFDPTRYQPAFHTSYGGSHFQEPQHIVRPAGPAAFGSGSPAMHGPTKFPIPMPPQTIPVHADTEVVTTTIRKTSQPSASATSFATPRTSTPKPVPTTDGLTTITASSGGRRTKKESETSTGSVDTSGIDPHFEPVVPLPEEVPVCTGEEEERTLFAERARLYRWVSQANEWKERGTGILKVLQHQTTHKCRLLMRREQVHKICLNHFVNADLKLNSHQSRECAWIWHAMDFADEEAKHEQFCVRFKSPEQAHKFKEVIDSVLQSMQDTPPRSQRQEPMTQSTKVQHSSQQNALPVKPAPEVTKSPVVPLDGGNKGPFLGCNKTTTGKASESPGQKVGGGEAVLFGGPSPFTFGTSVPVTTAAAVTTTTVATPVFKFGTGSTTGTLQKEQPSPASGAFSLAPAKLNAASAKPAQGETLSFGGFTFKQTPIILPNEETSTNKAGQATGGTSASQKKQDEKKAAPNAFASFSFGASSGTSGMLRTPEQEPAKKPAENSGSTQTAAALGGGLFGSSSQTISFADLAKQNQSTSPNLVKTNQTQASSFAGAGAPVFGSAKPRPTAGQQAEHDGEEEGDDGNQDEEYEPSGDFKPVVPLPALVEVKTGEEHEEVLFSERGKLFRFNTDTKEFKERGLGDLKILRDPATDKRRVVMRREQVHKLCANHNITADMILMPLAKSDRAYTWTAMDFSEGELQKETLAIRFKGVEEAEKFKAVFEACVKVVSDAGKSKPISSTTAAATVSENASTMSLAEKFKPAPGSWACKACYVRNGAELVNCQCCGSDRDGNPPKAGSGLGLAQSQPPAPTSSSLFGFGTGAALNTAGSFAPNTAPKPLFGFGVSSMEKSAAPTFGGFGFGAPAVTSTPSSGSATGPTFSLGVAHTARTSDRTDSEHQDAAEDNDENEYYQNDSTDNIHFTPLVQLPEREVETGEEEEQTLFEHRAKLFRLVDGEFKERGLGDFKLLQHRDTGKVRALMRREQTLKVCLNHYLFPGMLPKAKDADKKTYIWCAKDFADEIEVDETFAIRFKDEAIGATFFNSWKDALASITPGESPMKQQQQSKPDVKAGGVETPGKVDLHKSPATTEASPALKSFSFKLGPQTGTGDSFSFKLPQQTHASAPSFQHMGKPLFGASRTLLDETPQSNVSTDKQGTEGGNDDVEAVWQAQPTPEEEAMAARYQLPRNFYAYKSKPPCPGCRGCEKDGSDDDIAAMDGQRSVNEPLFDKRGTLSLDESGGGQWKTIGPCDVKLVADGDAMTYRVVCEHEGVAVLNQLVCAEYKLAVTNVGKLHTASWKGLRFGVDGVSQWVDCKISFSSKAACDEFERLFRQAIDMATNNNVTKETCAQRGFRAVRPEIAALSKFVHLPVHAKYNGQLPSPEE